jgi:hypothetical protein
VASREARCEGKQLLVQLLLMQLLFVQLHPLMQLKPLIQLVPKESDLAARVAAAHAANAARTAK